MISFKHIMCINIYIIYIWVSTYFNILILYGYAFKVNYILFMAKKKKTKQKYENFKRF